MSINTFFYFSGLEQKLPILIAYYKELPNNGAGGSLHIILDDGNLSHSCITFCSDLCEQKGDSLGQLICDILIQYSEDELQTMASNGWQIGE